MSLEASTTFDVLSVCVEQSEVEKIFLRVDGALKGKWLAMCQARQIDQSKAGRALIEWIVKQSPYTQIMVLGQMPSTQEQIANSILEGIESPPRTYRRAARKSGQ